MMDDSTIDEIVEGKRDWVDSSHYVEQESKENKEFFDGVDKVLKDMETVRSKPSKGLVQSILKNVSGLIRHGENLLKGVHKHLLEPAAKVEITNEDLKGKKPAHKAPLSPEKLESTVSHYADILKSSIGDEKKTISLLKELFDTVGPSIKEDRASLASRTNFASILIRIAHSTPELRPRLLPVIKKAVEA
jgi:hypothetical protein